MKRIYIIIIFIVCVVVAFFVTKAILDKPVVEPNPPSEILPDDTTEIDPVVVPEPTPVPVVEKDIKQDETLKKENKGKDKGLVEEESDMNAKKEDTPKKHVNISLSEMKQLIENGTYVRDRRLSKKYKIEYVDISEDDALEGLQQNLTYVQQRVDFGDDDDNGWRGFEVVGLDYDEQGLVNCVKIKPIY